MALGSCDTVVAVHQARWVVSARDDEELEQLGVRPRVGFNQNCHFVGWEFETLSTVEYKSREPNRHTLALQPPIWASQLARKCPVDDTWVFATPDSHAPRGAVDEREAAPP